jgi:hypothetical protein
MSLRKFVTSLAVLATVIVLTPSPNRADTVYSYTGIPFDFFQNASCPPTCNMTGSFTVASPLAPNITGMPAFTPLSFSFTDGSTTFTNVNSTLFASFAVNTNATGSITDWGINLIGPGSGGGLFTFFDHSAAFQQGVNVQSYEVESCVSQVEGVGCNTGGTWSVGTTVPSPEPSTSTLLCAGILLALISPLLRRLYGQANSASANATFSA